MTEEIKKLEEEKAMLLKKLEEIEQNKTQALTRIVEIQGVLKYIKEKEKK